MAHAVQRQSVPVATITHGPAANLCSLGPAVSCGSACQGSQLHLVDRGHLLLLAEAIPKRGASVVTHAKESKSNSIFMTAKKNLLPGGTGVPNTPWRRLLASLQGAGTLSDLYWLHISNSHKPAWRPLHDAALLMRAAAITYPVALASPGFPQKLTSLVTSSSLQPSALVGSTATSTASTTPPAAPAVGSASVAVMGQTGAVYVRDKVQGPLINAPGSRAFSKAMSSLDQSQQLVVLLATVAPTASRQESIRRVEGTQAAQLLVAFHRLCTPGHSQDSTTRSGGGPEYPRQARTSGGILNGDAGRQATAASPGQGGRSSRPGSQPGPMYSAPVLDPEVLSVLHSRAAAVVQTVARELNREGGKKLPLRRPALLSELVAALGSLVPPPPNTAALLTGSESLLHEAEPVSPMTDPQLQYTPGRPHEQDTSSSHMAEALWLTLYTAALQMLQPTPAPPLVPVAGRQQEERDSSWEGSDNEDRLRVAVGVDDEEEEGDAALSYEDEEDEEVVADAYLLDLAATSSTLPPLERAPRVSAPADVARLLASFVAAGVCTPQLAAAAEEALVWHSTSHGLARHQQQQNAGGNSQQQGSASSKHGRSSRQQQQVPEAASQTSDPSVSLPRNPAPLTNLLLGFASAGYVPSQPLLAAACEALQGCIEEVTPYQAAALLQSLSTFHTLSAAQALQVDSQTAWSSRLLGKTIREMAHTIARYIPNARLRLASDELSSIACSLADLSIHRSRTLTYLARQLTMRRGLVHTFTPRHLASTAAVLALGARAAVEAFIAAGNTSGRQQSIHQQQRQGQEPGAEPEETAEGAGSVRGKPKGPSWEEVYRMGVAVTEAVHLAAHNTLPMHLVSPAAAGDLLEQGPNQHRNSQRSDPKAGQRSPAQVSNRLAHIKQGSQGPNQSEASEECLFSLGGAGLASILTALAHVQQVQGMMKAHSIGKPQQVEVGDQDNADLAALGVDAGIADAAKSAAMSFACNYQQQLSGSDVSRMHTALRLLGGPQWAEEFMSAVRVCALV